MLVYFRFGITYIRLLISRLYRPANFTYAWLLNKFARIHWLVSLFIKKEMIVLLSTWQLYIILKFFVFFGVFSSGIHFQRHWLRMLLGNLRRRRVLTWLPLTRQWLLVLSYSQHLTQVLMQF